MGTDLVNGGFAIVRKTVGFLAVTKSSTVTSLNHQKTR